MLRLGVFSPGCVCCTVSWNTLAWSTAPWVTALTSFRVGAVNHSDASMLRMRLETRLLDSAAPAMAMFLPVIFRSVKYTPSGKVRTSWSNTRPMMGRLPCRSWMIFIRSSNCWRRDFSSLISLIRASSTTISLRRKSLRAFWFSMAAVKYWSPRNTSAADATRTPPRITRNCCLRCSRSSSRQGRRLIRAISRNSSTPGRRRSSTPERRWPGRRHSPCRSAPCRRTGWRPGSGCRSSAGSTDRDPG